MFAVETLDPLENAAHHVLRHLPIHIAPQADEALVSWFSRLARRYYAPPLALAQAASGFRFVAPRRSREEWWQRPGPTVIQTISLMTGVGVERVRATTFEDWAPSCRHEGTADRLSTRHFRIAQPDGRRIRRFVVCPACAALTDAITHEAHEPAIQLQTSLLDAKRLSMTMLAGLGAVDWPMSMAAIDVFLGMVWIGTGPNQRRRLLMRIADDLNFDPFRRGMADNYAGLLILAWLLDEWPHRLGMAMHILRTVRLRRLVDRWHDIDSDLREGWRRSRGRR